MIPTDPATIKAVDATAILPEAAEARAGGSQRKHNKIQTEPCKKVYGTQA